MPCLGSMLRRNRVRVRCELSLMRCTRDLIGYLLLNVQPVWPCAPDCHFEVQTFKVTGGHFER